MWERKCPAKRALFFLFSQCRRLEEFVSLLLIFSFPDGFDRLGIERPATEAIATRVSRGPVSYGHGQGTAGIAFVALLESGSLPHEAYPRGSSNGFLVTLVWSLLRPGYGPFRCS